jgi:predicted TIM-barrel fold metal-dependent hydrolase
LPVTIPVIDTDTHLTEPRNLWTARLPKKYTEEAPQVRTHPKSGVARWTLGGRWLGGDCTLSSRIPGEQSVDIVPATWEEVDPACWDAKSRLGWMDSQGIYAQVIYPNFVAFEGHAIMALKDKELQLQLIRTYNDYLVEWASPAPERFVLVASLPFWDIEESIREMTRCRDLGFRGVLWAATLNRHGLPQFYDTHWDRFYATAQDLAMSINFHVGVGYTEDDSDAAHSIMDDAADFAYRSSIGFLSNARTIAKLITFGVCHRFPNLPFVSVESGFGFVPFLIEALDWQWRHMSGPTRMPERLLPSEYFRRQIYGTFWFEQSTLAQLPDWADNVMFETDYPHNTCLIPGSQVAPAPKQIVAQHIDRFGEELMSKVLYKNAARVYGLEIASSSAGSP